jgi:tetratricopeptide (TPR) repeat protein
MNRLRRRMPGREMHGRRGAGTVRVSWVLELALAASIAGQSLSAFGQSANYAPQSTSAPTLEQQKSAPGGAKSSGAPQSTAKTAPAQITPAETQAYSAIEKQFDPDKQLQLAKTFIQQFPKSPLLTSVLSFAASDEEQKNDVPNAIQYGEESLKLNPDNLASLVMVAWLLPLAQALALQGTPPQKVQQLNQSEADAHLALQLLAKLQPGADLSAAQLQQEKTSATAQIQSALGMVHLQKSVLSPKPPATADPGELALAEKHFRSAIAIPQPSAEDVFRLGEVYFDEGKLDDSVKTFTQAAQLSKGTALEKLADQMIAKVQAAKSKSAPPKPNQ